MTIAPFAGHGKTLLFTPDRLEIAETDGTVGEFRANPETAYEGHVRETPWDRFHAAFFAGEALWTYLTLSFLYTYPGFEVEEIAPWHEDGEIWRSLKATFPDTITGNTRTQITRFGADGLMRRHNYTVDILEGARSANYTSDYHDFQGIKMPGERRIYAYDDATQKVPEPLLVSLDFANIVFP